MSSLTDTTDELANANGHEEQAPKGGADSLAARIRRRHDAQIQNQELLLPFPGWSGDLVMRYRVLDRAQIERYIEKAQQGKADIGANADLLSDACSGVFLRDDQTEELVEQSDTKGLDVTYATLGEVLGYEEMRVRELIERLANGNHIAINAHAMKVVEWMEDTSRKVEGSLQGESPASLR